MRWISIGVINDAPRTFNNHMLVFRRPLVNEDPMEVPLIYSFFWVQIHDLPSGMMSEAVAKQFRAFFGSFVEYDAEQISKGYQNYMRVRVFADVKVPLKKRKKLITLTVKQLYARFQYEKLTIFYFLCSRLGHGDSFYLLAVTTKGQEIKLGWDLSLRAPEKRAITTTSVWLREDDGRDPFENRICGKDQSSEVKDEEKKFSQPREGQQVSRILGFNLEGKSKGVWGWVLGTALDDKLSEEEEGARLLEGGHWGYQNGA
ncbi:hypothetical protein Gorai_007308, partial [Gossypium raimondii]|nr:hypothetical protein [Gossypium raimondii]